MKAILETMSKKYDEPNKGSYLTKDEIKQLEVLIKSVDFAIIDRLMDAINNAPNKHLTKDEISKIDNLNFEIRMLDSESIPKNIAKDESELRTIMKERILSINKIKSIVDDFSSDITDMTKLLIDIVLNIDNVKIDNEKLKKEYIIAELRSRSKVFDFIFKELKTVIDLSYSEISVGSFLKNFKSETNDNNLFNLLPSVKPEVIKEKSFYENVTGKASTIASSLASSTSGVAGAAVAAGAANLLGVGPLGQAGAAAAGAIGENLYKTYNTTGIK